MGAFTFTVGGSALWCRARTALTRPAAPAAALVCPICPLTEPMAVCRGRAPPRSYTARSASTSAASPATVPVPWASTSSIPVGGISACR